MQKLLWIKRNNARPLFFGMEGWDPQIIPTEKFEVDRDYATSGMFFLAEEREAEGVMRRLAELNPGCEVAVYGLEKVGQCPAGDFVAKAVSKDGLLPA